MAAIYHPGLVTIVPEYNIGRPTPAANVLNFQTNVTGLTIAQLTAIQTSFDSNWSNGWKGLATSQDHYIGSIVIDNSGMTGQKVTNSGYSPVAGTQAANALADQVAFLLSLKATNRYRGGHSRIYIPGLAAAQLDVTGQVFSAATITAMQTMWDTTIGALEALPSTSGGPLVPVIWHKHLTANPNSVEVIINRVGNATSATQRRRIRKVSRHKKKVA